MGVYIYLDDMRTPDDSNWIVVRDYHEFVEKVLEIGLSGISLISFDHDLGDTAVKEYFNNVVSNYIIDYDNIEEKTGYDAIKWLVNHYYDLNPDRLEMDRRTKKDKEIIFPTITVHSANPIGAHNIMGFLNNFLLNEGQEQNCIRVQIPHSV